MLTPAVQKVDEFRNMLALGVDLNNVIEMVEKYITEIENSTEKVLNKQQEISHLRLFITRQTTGAHATNAVPSWYQQTISSNPHAYPLGNIKFMEFRDDIDNRICFNPSVVDMITVVNVSQDKANPEETEYQVSLKWRSDSGYSPSIEWFVLSYKTAQKANQVADEIIAAKNLSDLQTRNTPQMSNFSNGPAPYMHHPGRY